MYPKHTDGTGRMPASPRSQLLAAGLSCCLWVSQASGQTLDVPVAPATPPLIVFAQRPAETDTVPVDGTPLEAPATAPTRAISPQLYRLPDLIGDFFAHASSARVDVVVPNNVSLRFNSAAPINAFDGGPRPLAFNGIQYVGPHGFVFNATGSGIVGVQPATILGTIPSNQITLIGPGQTTVGLRENQLFTQAVQSLFPGATFVSGSGLYTFTNAPGTPVPPIRPPGPFDYFQNVFVYSALVTNHQTIDVLVSNPAGGGLVGRNRWFENSSAIPRDRVFDRMKGRRLSSTKSLAGCQTWCQGGRQRPFSAA
jgi:hypothetical protein